MKSNWQIIAEFIKVSWPISLASVVYSSQIVITLYYIRIKGSLRDMSAVGLANMMISTFGTCVLQGMNGGVETLVSQANGSGN